MDDDFFIDVTWCKKGCLVKKEKKKHPKSPLCSVERRKKYHEVFNKVLIEQDDEYIKKMEYPNTFNYYINNIASTCQIPIDSGGVKSGESTRKRSRSRSPDRTTGDSGSTEGTGGRGSGGDDLIWQCRRKRSKRSTSGSGSGSGDPGLLGRFWRSVEKE